MLILMVMKRENARRRPVHLDNEPTAQLRRITSESGAYRISDRVLFEAAPGDWRTGHVDHRAPSEPGGVVMVTSDRR